MNQGISPGTGATQIFVDMSNMRGGASAVSNILLENSDNILLENGINFILTE